MGSKHDTVRRMALIGAGLLLAGSISIVWRFAYAEGPPCAGGACGCACGQRAQDAVDAAGGDAATRAPLMAGAVAELDRLDTRQPVPLLPMMAHHQKQNMRDHLVVIQEIAAALAKDDFPGVETAGRRIAYSEGMATMCRHMGQGAPGFTEQALNFHRTADGIVEAARKKDRAGVLLAVSQTLQTCTGCHSAFKQRIVGGGAAAAAHGVDRPGHGFGSPRP